MMIDYVLQPSGFYAVNVSPSRGNAAPQLIPTEWVYESMMMPPYSVLLFLSICGACSDFAHLDQRHAATIASNVKNTTQFAGKALFHVEWRNKATMSYGQLKSSDHPPILSFFRFFADRRRDRKDEMMGQTDLMSVGANPLQNTRIPSALTALLAAVAMDIRPGTLPVESGCTD